MQANRASIRREIEIASPAEAVWELVGDPARIAEWFPGIDAAEAVGDERVVTLHSGLRVTEHIVTRDPLQRRFQYQIVGGPYRFHLATLDVIALSGDRSLVVSSTDAEPAAAALVLGGAAGAALGRLAELMEQG